MSFQSDPGFNRIRPAAASSQKPAASAVDPQLLTRFLPFRRLSALELLLLSRQARLFDVRRGMELAAIGETDTDDIFLLEGDLALIARDGAVRRMSAGAANALGGVAQLRPRQFRVVAESSAKVLLLPYSLMEILPEHERVPYQVEEMELDLSEDDDRLFAALLIDLPRQNVRLPVTRAGAASIRALIQHPQIGMVQLAQAAMIEPSVALRLIGAANHPFMNAPVAVQSCFEAVARLGVDTSRRLLHLFTSSEQVPDRYSAVAGRFATAVRQSREVAYLCAQLSEFTPGLLAARAYLVGLLHAAGEIAALTYAGAYPELSLDGPRLESCLTRVRPLLGATLLREYGLNGEIVTAATVSDDWERDHGSDGETSADYADLVILAQLHCAIGTARARAVPPMHTVPAFQRVARGELTPTRSMAMIRIARAQAETGRAPELAA
ncbi:HDOD domain-containing protein [Permianibacter sp. IMCC34836]|uniref:HDOD domain-containing protein n=1 Tax=Permianibacter fluminis TaxID=2738515 RepID=UPI0015574078|nr:HDOD domain-containing protein [Permianibacter fluminis]NQD38282.1 HDOD domain-containing protein [Permianibacter fluminis]